MLHKTAQRAARELERLLANGLKPGLYVVATPIGNLGDITLRALATLAGADVIYCEDTRHSRTLLAHYAILRPLRAYHDHSNAKDRNRIVADLEAGRRVALISDAGTPLISDPGYKLVRAVLAAGHEVTALPGPSAALAALVPAGLPTDGVYFSGFLPSKTGQRQTRLRALQNVPGTMIFFETASRLAASLADMVTFLPGRELVVARELTKLHEQFHRGSPEELMHWAKTNKIRGEIVVLTGPPAAIPVSDDLIKRHLAGVLDEMSLRDAAKAIATDLKVPRGRVYDLGLAMKNSA